MMNRGILNPIQYRLDEPVTADCFEADIETINVEGGYSIIPPLFGVVGMPDIQEYINVPEIDVNLYVDGQLVGQISAPETTLQGSEQITNRITSILEQIPSEYILFQEYGVHRVKIEPVEEKAGRARGLGYSLLVLTAASNVITFPLTLLQQPSNTAYYESEDNIGTTFKILQFIGMTLRNEVVIEPIPYDKFPTAHSAYFGQFIAASAPRVTITAQNGQNLPEVWRGVFLMSSSISQLRILGDIMDANVTGEYNRWDVLESLVGERGLHIYVNKNLVDNYKALNETIAPYVFSDEVIPDPPVIIASGVYHNPTLGLISVRNNTYGTCITFADKNLGATRVYNSGDTLSQENCGYFYQRGNNHGFPWGSSGSIAAPTSSTQVDTTGYGPGNYYNQNLFITGNNDWSSVDNQGLWGDLVQGPCPNGFHIMSISDVDRYHSVLTGTSRLSGVTSFMMLRMPPEGAIKFDGVYDNTRPCYWLGTPTTYTGLSWILNTPTNPQILTRRMYRAYGGYIRPVKDEPVIPDSTRTKLY